MALIKAEYNATASEGLLTYSNGNKRTVTIRGRNRQAFTEDVAAGYLDRFEIYPSDTVEQVAQFYQTGDTVVVFESKE